jgi:hypothetical protein
MEALQKVRPCDLYRHIQERVELRKSVDAAKWAVPRAPQTYVLFRQEVLQRMDVALLVVESNPWGAALPVSIVTDPIFIEYVFRQCPKWAKFIPKCDGRTIAFQKTKLIDCVMEHIRNERCSANVLKYVPTLKVVTYAACKLREREWFCRLVRSRNKFASLPVELQAIVADMLGYVKSKWWRNMLQEIASLNSSRLRSMLH